MANAEWLLESMMSEVHIRLLAEEPTRAVDNNNPVTANDFGGGETIFLHCVLLLASERPVSVARVQDP